MSDDPISERDGPMMAEMTLAERQWTELQEHLAPMPSLASPRPVTTRHRCSRCGHDTTTDPTPGELAALDAYIETASEKLAAAKLGVSLSAIKNRLSHLCARTETDGAVQAAFRRGRGDWGPQEVKV